MKARELMTSNPECVTPDDTIERAAQIMRDIDIGFVPVVDDRDSMRLSGVITDRDIAIRHVAEGDANGCSVRDHMTRDGIRTVRPDDDVDDVLDQMKSEQVRRIPVVDGDRLIGVIAQADIATEDVSDSKTADMVEQISEPGRPRR